MSELDLDAVVAAQDEAAGEPHKVMWGGETFAVPRSTQWPLETFDLMTQGRMADALAGVLGDQWDAFWKARRPTMGAAEALLDGIAQAEGFQNAGESRASSPSPNRATRRSRQTSSASTR